MDSARAACTVQGCEVVASLVPWLGTGCLASEVTYDAAPLRLVSCLIIALICLDDRRSVSNARKLRGNPPTSFTPKVATSVEKFNSLRMAAVSAAVRLLTPSATAVLRR